MYSERGTPKTVKISSFIHPAIQEGEGGKLKFDIQIIIFCLVNRKKTVNCNCKKNIKITGFLKPNLAGTGIGYIIPGQGEFGK